MPADKCPTCHQGTGQPGCPTCHGSGWVPSALTVTMKAEVQPKSCPECGCLAYTHEGICPGVDVDKHLRLAFLADAVRQYLEALEHGRVDGVLLGYLKTASARVEGRA